MKTGTRCSNKRYLLPVSVILIWLLLVSTAYSQETGILEGRLINGTDADRVPGGVPLEIVALSGGMSIIRTGETDADGRFRIETLPLHSMLMLRALFQDASYNSQFNFDDSGRAYIEMDVFEATTSMKGIRVEEYQIVFQATGNSLQSLDTILIVNATDPPRTFMDPEGNFRFSKVPAIEGLPQMRITAPGSSMPVVQSALESPDGQTYYSLYPLRPGRTAVDIFQRLPYESRKYTFVKKFYYAVPSIEIGVIPMDMDLSGTGLSRIRTDSENNIAVYRSAPVEAGTEVEWILSGGTPVEPQEPMPSETGSGIRSIPNAVGRNTGVIVSLVLMGFVLVLWYAFNRTGGDLQKNPGARRLQLKKRRDALLGRLAELDRLFENRSIGSRDYFRQREDGKRALRRITLLLKKG